MNKVHIYSYKTISSLKVKTVHKDSHKLNLYFNKSTTRAMKNSHNACLPNLLIRNKSSNKSGTKPIVSPISLLDRVRDAMLRLIMVTAVSKSAPASHSNILHANNASLRQSYTSPSARNDTDHSQAVAECIEFIKKRSVYGCVLDEEDLESSSFKSSTNLDSPIVDGIPQLGMPFSVL